MLTTAALRAISTRTIRTSRCAAAFAALALLAVPAAAAASPTGPAGGALSGTYPNPEIAPSAVGSPELAGVVDFGMYLMTSTP